MYQINAREPPEKPINLKTFFQILSPLRSPSTKRSNLSTRSLNTITWHTSDWILPNGTSDIALWLSTAVSCGSGASAALRMMSSSRFQRAILRSMRLCPMTDGLNPAEMKIAVGFSPLQIPPHAVDLEFPRIRDSAVRHRVDRRQCTQVFDFRSTELSLRHIRPL